MVYSIPIERTIFCTQQIYLMAGTTTLVPFSASHQYFVSSFHVSVAVDSVVHFGTLSLEDSLTNLCQRLYYPWRTPLPISVSD